MRPVIGIDLSDYNTAVDLATVLSSMGAGMDIEIIDSAAGSGTAGREDKSETKGIHGSEDGAGHAEMPVIIDDERLKKTPSVSKLFESIREEYEEITGERLCIRTAERIKTLVFYSKMGGSGVTSLAMVFGRLLASKYGKKTLYVSVDGNRDWEKYIPEKESMDRINQCAGELEYRLSTGSLTGLDKYLYRDGWGLDLVELRSPSLVPKLKTFVDEHTDIECIIVDIGRIAENSSEKRTVMKEADRIFRIKSLRDARSVCENMTGGFITGGREKMLPDGNAGEYLSGSGNDINPDKAFCINTFAGYNRQDAEGFCIVHSPESFRRFGDRVEIAMDTALCIGVDRIICEIEDLFEE